MILCKQKVGSFWTNPTSINLSVFRALCVAAFFGASFATCLSGCHSSIAKSDASGNALFVVEQTSVLNSSPLVTADGWNLVGARHYTLRACLKDLAYLNPIVGQRVKITSQSPSVSVPTTQVITDTQGCVNWQETIEFNPVFPESYLTLNRNLELANSPQNGAVLVAMALNPWKGDLDSFYDLRFAHVPAKQLKADESSLSWMNAQAQAKATASLKVETISFSFSTMNYSNSGSDTTLQLSFRPALLRTGLDGAPISQDLTAGKMRAKVLLVQIGPAAHQRSVLAQSEVQAVMRQGLFQGDFLLHLNSIPNRHAGYEIQVAVTPVDAPWGLLGTEFSVGADKLGSSGWTTTTRPAESIEQQLKKLHDDGPTPVSSTETAPGAVRASVGDGKPKLEDVCAEALQTPGFVFDHVDASATGYTQISIQDTFPTEAGTSVKACVANPVDMSPVVDLPFEVSSQSERRGFAGVAPQIKRTDSQGCFYWLEKTQFDYLAGERWLPLEIQIKGLEAPYLGVTRKLKLFINPWEVGWLHAWDCRNGKVLENPRPDDSHLEVTDFSYEFIGRDLKVESGLNLTLTRNYRFMFQPILVRPYSFFEGPQFDGIREGRFKMTVLLLAPEDSPAGAVASQNKKSLADRYLNHFQKTVTARNGHIIEDVALSFRFTELPLVGSRDTLLLKLEPLDKSRAIKSITLSAPMSPIDDTGNLYLKPAEINVDEIIEKATAASHQMATAASSKELFQKFFTVPVLSVADLQKLQVTSAELEPALNGGTAQAATLSKFCSLAKPKATKPNSATSPSPVASKNETGLMDSWKKYYASLYPTANAEPNGQAKPGSLSALESDCRKNPADYLTISPATFVLSTEGITPDEQRGDAYTIQRDARFLRCNHESEDNNRSEASEQRVSLHSDLGISFPIKGIDISVGGGYSTDHTWTRAREFGTGHSRENCLEITTSREIKVDVLTLGLKAKTQRCVLIGAKDNNEAKNLRMFCREPALAPELIQESWYYITQAASYDSTPLRDPKKLSNRIWSKVIRGTQRFAVFRHALENKNAQYVLEADPDLVHSNADSDVARAFQGVPMFSDGNFPGLL